MNSTSRSLTQAEIDGFWRNEFCKGITDYIANGKVARFAVQTESGARVLVTVEQKSSFEWHFSVRGEHKYTYRYGDLLNALEKMWDKAKAIILFEDEINLDFRKPIANDDAEPSETGDVVR